MSLPASQQQLEAERKLVEAARTSPLAFGELYERYVDQIYSYVYNRVGDRTVAEDIVAETFHRALEHIRQFEWRGVAFSAWLYRIASNAIAARYRREPLMAGDEELDTILEPEPGPELALITFEWKADLMAAVRALPPEQQQAVLLRFGQELRNKEIARIMERSEGAVKALLHRALIALQRRLASAGE